MKPFLSILAIPAVTLIFSIPAHADFVGFKIGAEYWGPSLSGTFSSTGETDIDLSDDLGVDDPSPSSLVLTLEHPVPVLPNIRYRGIELDSKGNKPLTRDIVFDGQTYSAGETVSTNFDLTHDDVVLYYELMDNWVSLDFGLDVKVFDGEVSMVGSSNTVTSRIDVDETIPLLYLSARFDLPFSGFYVGADISNISIGDSGAEDATILLGYESDIGLGIEGGLKTFSLELDDVNELNSNLEYDGAFINGYFHF